MSEGFIGGAWRTLTRGEAYIGGKWRTLTHGEMSLDDAWPQVLSFVPPLSVSISPPSVSGTAFPSKPITATATTPFVTATPSGGKAPYTYAWVVASHDGTPPAISNPNSASTNFSKSVPANAEQEAVFTLTVTDALGKTASASIAATFFNQPMSG